MDHPAQDAVFTARLTPHRSLSRRGLAVVAGLILAVSGASSALFWWLGAWPILGFTGAEILAALLLIRHHAAGARQTEELLLRPHAVQICRTDRAGRVSTSQISTAWLRIGWRQMGRAAPSLVLIRHGCAMEIAAQLNTAEKHALAQAMGQALDRLRQPDFGAE